MARGFEPFAASERGIVAEIIDLGSNRRDLIEAE